MNKLTLAALGLAAAFGFSGAALHVAQAHAATTQLQSAPAVQTEAATTEIVKKNFNNPPAKKPIKKKKKKPVHHTAKKPTHPTKKKPVHHKKKKPATT